MKKVVFVALIVVLLMAVALPAFAGKQEKVNVCHVIAANDVIPFFTVNLYFGKVISVSASAVPAHEAHGDAAEGAPNYFTNLTAIEAFRNAGAHLPVANCYVSHPLAG